MSATLALPAAPVLADPPDHAPAHGWRKKHDPDYRGYRGHGGREWERDYGVLNGRCSAEAVGAVVGGAIGGVVGSGIGEGLRGERLAALAQEQRERDRRQDDAQGQADPEGVEGALRHATTIVV